MPIKSWTLLDVEKNIYLENFDFSETLECTCPVSGKRKSITYRITKRRLGGGLQDGVDVIEIDNGRMTTVICPTRGMGVLRADCDGLELKWDAPARGPVHPKFVPLSDASGLGWLDGFTEWVVRCGLESHGSPEFNEKGALLHSLHGKIANTPASQVELSVDTDTGEIMLSGIVEESRLFFRKLRLRASYSTFLGSPELTLNDTVTNISGQAGDFELLYHINTGMPFISPGAKIQIPFEVMAPRNDEAASELPHWSICDPESPGSNEIVYFFQPAGDKDGTCPTLLIGEKEEHALAIDFNVKQIPYMCVWKCRLARADGYVIGFEPCLSFPNTKSYEKEQGRVVDLKAGESRSTRIRFAVLSGAAEVAAAKAKVEAVQKTAAGTVEKGPKQGWG